MASKAPVNDFDGSIENIIELQDFLFPLLLHAATKPPKTEDDIALLAKEAGVTVPASLKGEKIVWNPKSDGGTAAAAKGSVISIVRPGNPEAVGLTIGCVKIRKWKICLECSWIFCKIVISRRF